jgi:uncharacterized protein YndB with AHSA1/START domain
MSGEDQKGWELQYCEDEAFIPAPPDVVFDALLDVPHWNNWWEAMRFDVGFDRPAQVGDRITFDGGVFQWTVEVVSIDRPSSIRLRYVEGALVGDTEWRVVPAPGGCKAAYIYHGVRPTVERAATTFGKFGTTFHSMVTHADALDGLARLVTGQPLDEAWRQGVRDKIAAGRADLTAQLEKSQ